MNWHITVLSRDGQRLIFHGSTRDAGELEQTAALARAERPDAQIWIKPPIGRVYAWVATEPDGGEARR